MNAAPFKSGLKSLFITIPAILLANTVQANSGSLNLVGAVNAVTCNISVESETGSPVTMIDLGTSAVDSAGQEVIFHLSPDTSDSNCDLTNLNAEVTWSGSNLGPQGIENGSGTATGSRALLKARPLGGAVEITSVEPSYQFLQNQMQPDSTLQFSAQLVAGSVPGTFASTVAYSVSYY